MGRCTATRASTIAACVVMLFGGTIHADELSLLQRLSDETQALYQGVRPGIVRIHLPPTIWPAETSENVMEKWKSKLNPEVRRQIEQAQLGTATGGDVHVRARIQPTTQPAGSGATTQPASPDSSAPRLALRPREDGGIELGSASATGAPYDSQVTNVSLKVVGLILDESGHVLVPLYIEKDALGDAPLRITSGDGKSASATFVGSDRQTNLTVLKLTETIGRPVRITGGRPPEGALVMVLSPSGDAGRLTIWTGGHQDRGVVVTMDGAVVGFARYGQFLCCGSAKSVIHQLVEFGHVRRATLGVLVEEIETADGRRTLRIEKVVPNTAADKVGLQPGDFILSMGGAPVGDLPSFAAAIASRDGETELEILRKNESFKVTVVLRPK